MRGAHMGHGIGALRLDDGAITEQQCERRGDLGRGELVEALDELILGGRAITEDGGHDAAFGGGPVEQSGDTGGDGFTAQGSHHTIIEGPGGLGPPIAGHESQITAVVPGTEDSNPS